MKKITISVWVAVAIFQAQQLIAGPITPKPVHAGELNVKLDTIEGEKIFLYNVTKDGKLTLVDPTNGTTSFDGTPNTYEWKLSVKKGGPRLELSPDGTLLLVRLDNKETGQFTFCELNLAVKNGVVEIDAHSTYIGKAYINDQEKVVVPAFENEHADLAKLVMELCEKAGLTDSLESVENYEADAMVDKLVEGMGIITHVNVKEATADITGRANSKHATGTVKLKDLLVGQDTKLAIRPGMPVKLGNKNQKITSAVLETVS